MKQRLYIDGKPAHELALDLEAIKAAVLAGHLVVAVDEGGVAVQIVPDMLTLHGPN